MEYVYAPVLSYMLEVKKVPFLLGGVLLTK